MFIYLYFYVAQQLRMEAADLLIFIGKSILFYFWFHTTSVMKGRQGINKRV